MDPLNPTTPSPAASSPEAEDTGASRSFSLGRLIGGLFLVSQAIFVLQTHFSADSSRVLTPVAGLTQYELHATFAERPLTPAEIQSRYGIASRDEVALTAAAVRAAVAHREKPIPLTRALLVRLRTREANGTEAYWLWPQE